MDGVLFILFILVCIAAYRYYLHLHRDLIFPSFQQVAKSLQLDRVLLTEDTRRNVHGKLRFLSYLKNNFFRGRISNYFIGKVENWQVELYHLRLFKLLRTEDAYNMADIDVFEIVLPTNAFVLAAGETNDIKLTFNSARNMVQWGVNRTQVQDLFLVKDPEKVRLLTAGKFTSDKGIWDWRLSKNFIRYAQGRLFIMAVHSALTQPTVTQEELLSLVATGLYLSSEMQKL